MMDGIKDSNNSVRMQFIERAKVLFIESVFGR
jgi:hypothetical protein